MIDLILTMMVTLDDVGGLFLNFTKNDIDTLIKKYDVLNKHNCNERGMIILWKKNYITNEEFAKYMGIEYDEGSFWLVANNFDDILSYKYETEISYLDGDDHHNDSYYDFTANDIKNYHWDDYNDETLKAIIDFCIKKDLEIDEELITNENTILEDNDIYFNDTRLVNYLDELDELRESLSLSIGEAQESADIDDIYKKINDSFIEDIGPYKYKTINNKNKLYIELSNVDYNEIENWLKEEYDEYDFVEEKYGNLYYILRERDFFNFDTPDYNHIYGDIDKATLNECTQNRLDFD